MLPATTAIINVYQLEDKWKRGGARDKRSIGRGTPVRETREVREEAPRTSTASGSGRAKPPREESTETSPAFPTRRYYTSGIRRGDLLPLKNESNSDYMKANAEHRKKMIELRDKAQEKVSKVEKEYEEKIGQRNKENEDVLKAQRREDPVAALGKLSQQVGVKTDTNEGRWANNKGYTRYDPSNPTHRITIEQAIKYASKEGLLNTVPPAIMGVKRTLREPPKSYYIQNELQWYNQRSRRKKLKHPMAKRKPIVKNSKKRHVVKHKGGRR
jgi:hypothetical protein